MKIIKNNLFMLKIYLQKVFIYLIMVIVNTTSSAKIRDVVILLILFGALSLLSAVFEI